LGWLIEERETRTTDHVAWPRAGALSARCDGPDEGRLPVTNHKIVSRDEWTAERLRLLAREKELRRLLDQAAAERRQLPWL
jgi:hypothetical protein